jgi:3-mercaptopyruvate sulfurtransferase SseA
MLDWNDKVKRLLKSELIKRAVSNTDLAQLLREAGIEETKASVDSKISRGTFSASFFIQCLSVIGCSKIEIEEYETNLMMVAEPTPEYKTSKNGK